MGEHLSGSPAQPVHDETVHPGDVVCAGSVFLDYFDLTNSRIDTRVYNGADPEPECMVC